MKNSSAFGQQWMHFVTIMLSNYMLDAVPKIGSKSQFDNENKVKINKYFLSLLFLFIKVFNKAFLSLRDKSISRSRSIFSLLPSNLLSDSCLAFVYLHHLILIIHLFSSITVTIVLDFSTYLFVFFCRI